jgi:hypothetical protein
MVARIAQQYQREHLCYVSRQQDGSCRKFILLRDLVYRRRLEHIDTQEMFIDQFTGLFYDPKHACPPAIHFDVPLFSN